MSEKDMYDLIMTNYDDLMSFAKKLQKVKDHQRYLEFKPVIGKY